MEGNDKIELKVYEVSKGVSFKEMFILILREVNGTRKLPMLLSRFEAAGIVNCFRGKMECFGSEPTNENVPLTDTIKRLAEAFDIIVEEVLISGLEHGVYQTMVSFRQNGILEQIATPAADGILLAMQFRCPIYITSDFFDRQTLTQPGSHGVALPINSLDVDLLKDALEGAIEKENYEMAEVIRNEIKRRES